jgi:threonine dehydratase
VGAPVYVSVGDGGNIDGVAADNFTYAPAAELLGVQ